MKKDGFHNQISIFVFFFFHNRLSQKSKVTEKDVFMFVPRNFSSKLIFSKTEYEQEEKKTIRYIRIQLSTTY